jgi:nucleoid-associated protein YgaU
MKFHKLLIFMMVFSLAVISNSVFAQDDDDDETMEEPEEMDEETWQAQMDEYTARKTDLENQLNSLNSEIDGLKNQLDQKKETRVNAESTLYNMVGSLTGYQEYKTKFADCEKRVNACKGPDDAAAIQKDCMDYLANTGKYRCMGEFWDRFNTMKKKITDCMGKVETGTYTVVRGDCLYKIAGMSNIYGNPRLWPAIWDANKGGVVSAPPRIPTTIPNPNLIYPGQVLKIPTLTDAQKTEAMSRWGDYKGSRKKKRTMKTDTSTKTEMKKDTTKK